MIVEIRAGRSGSPRPTSRVGVVRRACLAAVFTLAIARVESVAVAAEDDGPLGLLPTLPLPSLPLTSLPVPTLALPTVPIPTVPVATVPVPTLPLPTIPLPGGSLPLPTLPLPSGIGPPASPIALGILPSGGPGEGARPSEPASAGSSGPGASGAPGSSDDPLVPAGPGDAAPGGGTFGAIILPALIAGIPIAMIALILAAQTAGGAAWLTVVRRWLNRTVLPMGNRARR